MVEELIMTAEIMGEILGKLVEDGFEAPIILTGVGTNGSVMVAEYTVHAEGYLDCQIIAERTRDGTFTVPVNMLFVDARGEAARVVLDKTGKPQYLH